jgi:hypothetical protein
LLKAELVVDAASIRADAGSVGHKGVGHLWHRLAGLRDVNDTRACNQVVDASPIFFENEANIGNRINHSYTGDGADNSVHDQSKH